MSKTAREILNRLKYPIDLDGLTIDQALSSLRELLPVKKDMGYVGTDGDGNPDFTNEQKEILGYNHAISEMKEVLK